MTDSMKFGPEWLRNMSTDASIIGTTHQNNSNSSGGGGNNSTSATTNNVGQQNDVVNTSVPRNLFPEFRYGREEMLLLFNKNCNTPEILSSFKNLYVERVQCPLALTPSSEEEMLPLSGLPINVQRPMWVQRSPVGFNSSIRNVTRGSLTDRARIRGKSIYHPHPTFQRSSAGFEDDMRIAPLKSDRNWSERNGSGCDNIANVSNSDWSTPVPSPRREFSSQSRNIENWRCNRNEESSTEVTYNSSGGDGWRAHNNSSNFNTSTHRWGRSTSWRDEDISTMNNDNSFSGTSSNCNNNSLTQRSLSTLSNSVLESKSATQCSSTPNVGQKSIQNFTPGLNAAKQTSCNTSGIFSEDGNEELKPNSHHQWTTDEVSTAITNSANEVNEDQNLPEWAMENPSAVGGTFDATGAFHGGGAPEDVSSSSGGHTHRPEVNCLRKDCSSSPSLSSSFSGDNCAEVPESNNNGRKEENKCISQSKADILKKCEIDKKSSKSLIDINKQTEDSCTETVQNEVKQEKFSDSAPVCKHSTPNEDDDIVARDTKSANKNFNENVNMKQNESTTTALIDECKIPETTEGHANNGNKDFTDPMMQVADDMIVKLIMDDDSATKQHNIAKEVQPLITSSNIMLTNQLSEPIVYQHQHLHPPVSVASKTIYNMGQSHNYDVNQQQIRHLQMMSGSDGRNRTSLDLSSNVITHPVVSNAPCDLWFYRDPQGKVQGPFSALEMTEWYRAGYFNENLFVRRVCDVEYRSLGELLKLCNGQMPFSNSHLIPISVNPLANTQNLLTSAVATSQTDYTLKDIKTLQNDNVATLKHLISPMDMSHILNAVHYHTMQEQFLCGQELELSNEFAKSKNAEVLSMHEREAALALIRQKSLQMTTIPGILNNLNALDQANNATGSGNNTNNLITNNNHMYHSSADSAKKEHQRLFKNQSTQPSSEIVSAIPTATSSFVDANHDNYMLIAAPTQTSTRKADFNTIRFTGNNKQAQQISEPNENISNDILNDLNLQMILRGTCSNAVDESHGTMTNSTNSHNFMADQEVFGTVTVPSQQQTSSILKAQNPMIQMWMNQLNATNNSIKNNTILHKVNENCHKSMNSLTLNNEWNGGSLVGIPNTLINNVPMGSTLGLTKPTTPTSIWDVNILEQHVQMQQQQQQVEDKKQQDNVQSMSATKKSVTNDYLLLDQKNSCDRHEKQLHNLSATSINKLSNINTQKNDIQESHNKQQSGRPVNNNKKQKKTDSVLIQQPTINSSKRGNNNKTQYSNSTEQFNNSELSKNNDDSNRLTGDQHQHEEKRKQKEEKKRYQQQQQMLDEDKCRVLNEDDKNRQNPTEIKGHQSSLQNHHRRKVTMASNSINNTFGDDGLIAGFPSINTEGNNQMAISNGIQLNVQKLQKDHQQRVHTSVAPWSQNRTSINIGPSLAEIQKAERRERRVDQQRQIEMQEKRVLTAAMSNEGHEVLKWNPPSVPVKSLAEIQAEEAKRLIYEQNEVQRRKEKEQQAAVTCTANVKYNGDGGIGINIITDGCVNGNSTSNKNIWNGAKIWGNSTISAAGGFWDDINRKKGASPNGLTTASTVSQCQVVQNQQSQKSKMSIQLINAPTSAAKVLKKSQAISITENTSQKKTSTASANNKNYQGSTSITTANSTTKNCKQNRIQKVGDMDKKNTVGTTSNMSVSKNHNISSSNKYDDYEAEFISWCTKSLNNMDAKVDVPTFAAFLRDLESPYEVKDYIRVYLGESKECVDFGKQFLERRSKYKNLQRAQNAHNDDLCKPAQAITPSINDSNDSKNKQKKIKKSKMTKLDANILGFSVTAAEGRINVGDRDYGDAP